MSLIERRVEIRVPPGESESIGYLSIRSEGDDKGRMFVWTPVNKHTGAVAVDGTTVEGRQPQMRLLQNTTANIQPTNTNVAEEVITAAADDNFLERLWRVLHSPEAMERGELGVINEYSVEPVRVEGKNVLGLDISSKSMTKEERSREVAFRKVIGGAVKQCYLFAVIAKHLGIPRWVLEAAFIFRLDELISSENRFEFVVSH